MKNIYEDDFSFLDTRSFREDEVTPPSAPISKNASSGTPVRPARQSPPPIKKSAAATPPQPEAAPYPPVAFPQPGYYPQPVFYQQNEQGQPYPVYYAPYPPQPFVPAPAYPSQPIPAEAPPSPAEPVNNEAGTRVLFQSADFDQKEDSSDEYNSFSEEITPVSFDLSEVDLHSKKVAPPPVKKAPSKFRVDEMEIGTYEFNIMTSGQASKSKNVLTPDEEMRQMSLTEENFIDEIIEEEPEKEEAETEAADEAFEVEDIKEDEKKTALPSKEIIRRAILAVSAVAIIIACATLINEYRLHRQNRDLMNDLSGLIITEPSTQAPSASPDDAGQTVTVPTTLPLLERPLTVEEQWEAIRAEYPDVTFPEKLQLKYAKLYGQNPDFVGYLYADGSELDTPVVQGENDKEYVEKNFYGESTKYACPFVTSSNNIETLDSNTVIYGHHMRDGSIFGKLDQYRNLDGYKKAPVITFNTLYQDYSFKVIAVMITNINPKHDNNYVFTYYWTNLNNELNHTAYLNQLSQRSLYDTGVDVLPSDKLLTLSTCCKDFDDARLVVVARLVRPGESTDVDTSKAVKNPKPRYPQAYYDAKGKKNPYADAYKWQIS